MFCDGVLICALCVSLFSVFGLHHMCLSMVPCCFMWCFVLRDVLLRDVLFGGMFCSALMLFVCDVVRL